jgi:hypothetical protein
MAGCAVAGASSCERRVTATAAAVLGVTPDAQVALIGLLVYIGIPDMLFDSLLEVLKRQARQDG